MGFLRKESSFLVSSIVPVEVLNAGGGWVEIDRPTAQQGWTFPMCAVDLFLVRAKNQ